MKYNPYSFSKIECWNSCPYKFKLNYLTDLERVPTENLALYRGSYFHHYIETGNKDFKINHIFTQEEKDACDKILKEFFNSDIYYHLENKGQHELKFSISTKLEFLPYNSKVLLQALFLQDLSIPIDRTLFAISYVSAISLNIDTIFSCFSIIYSLKNVPFFKGLFIYT